MKNSTIIVVLIAAMLLLSGAFAQQQAAPAPSSQPAAKTAPNPEFEKIKRLLGDWESKTPEGQVVPISFRLVSGGSAILVSSTEPKEGEMITVIHPDGKDLMATHYCSAKNQPRFVAVPSTDPNVVNFQFKDITNLASPDAPHMTGVAFTMVDATHHSEAWTWREGGKDQVFTFQLVRKAAAGK